MSECFVCVAGAPPLVAASKARAQGRLHSRCGSDVLDFSGGGFWAGVGGRYASSGRVTVSCRGNQSRLGIGEVRIDNREAIRSIVRRAGRRLGSPNSDIGLMLTTLESAGTVGLQAVVGDFAFVAWIEAEETITVARDWLGLHQVFVRQRDGQIEVASDADLLGIEGEFDDDFIASYLTGQPLGDPNRTVWRGVEALSPGTVLTWRQGKGESTAFASPWSIHAGRGGWAVDEVAEVRHRFDQSIEIHCTNDRPVWAELSGGLDSSSIVVSAAALWSEGRATARLAGTYTYSDSLTGSDPQHFVDAVVDQTGISNHLFRDFSPWQEDDEAPPLTSEPRHHYIYWARDRAARKLLDVECAAAVLCGDGSDHYLGRMSHLADVAKENGWVGALKRAHSSAAVRQCSMWPRIWREGVSWRLRRGMSPGDDCVPPNIPWISAATVRRAEAGASVARARRAVRGLEHGVMGERIRTSLHEIRRTLDLYPHGVHVERRYPFLYGPLVEFCLSLPLGVLFASDEPKWLVRSALGHRLPKTVRERSTKGSVTARVYWALGRHKRLLDSLMRDPISGALGWVDVDALRAQLVRARLGAPIEIAPMMAVLSLETWLVVRSGRWHGRHSSEHNSRRTG